MTHTMVVIVVSSSHSYCVRSICLFRAAGGYSGWSCTRGIIDTWKTSLTQLENEDDRKQYGRQMTRTSSPSRVLFRSAFCARGRCRQHRGRPTKPNLSNPGVLCNSKAIVRSSRRICKNPLKFKVSLVLGASLVVLYGFDAIQLSAMVKPHSDIPPNKIAQDQLRSTG